MDPANASWNEYWRQTTESAAHRGGGPQDAALIPFWSGLFAAAHSTRARCRVLDVACGNGAVLRLAREAANAAPHVASFLAGIDLSLAAVADLRRRLPTVQGAVCDVRRTPFPDGCFDLVTSQFGLEYAGHGAFGEAARVVAPGGVLAAVVHMKEGGIYRENQANLEAVTVLLESDLLGGAVSACAIEAGLRRGKGSRAGLRAAEALLGQAASRVRGMLERLGPQVAGGAIARLLGDVTDLHARRAAYDPAEVTGWIERMAAEMRAYAGRMSSALAAAASRSELDVMLLEAVGKGLDVRTSEPVPMGRDGEAGAWRVVLERPATP